MFIAIIFFLSWSLPAQAASDKLTFGLWDKYRNQIQIGYELGDEYGSLSYSNFITYENEVSTNSELITTFKNTAPIQPDYSGKYNFVNNFSLSVPTTKLSPEFFISNAFLNKDITFTIMLTVKINNGEFWQSSFENNPYFAFYVGSIENYSQIPCTLKNDYLTVNPSSLTYKADLTVNFKSTGFICGFFFRFGNSGGVGVRLDGNYNYPYFYTEYTLSPLNFSEVTVEDVGNAVGEALIKQEEYVKQEATQSGDKNVNSVLGGIPDFSTSWISNITTLVDCFQYEGTDFSLTWPSFSLPSLNINGLNTSSVKVWDEYTVDVEKVVNDVLPDVLLSIARILFTIALGLFCVVEVMDIILGVMTAFQVRIKN